MNDTNDLDRRSFITAALGTAAGIGAAALPAGSAAAAEAASGSSDLAKPPAGGPGSGGQFSLLRAEVTINDCEVEGKLPKDLDGGFFATGPDPQYPRLPGNIMFDGEGHVRVFRIKNGRVDYRTRYARGERYLAQDKAGRSLYPMYRNPYMDDPSVRGKSRATGGQFFQATDSRALKGIFDLIDQLEKRELIQKRYVAWRELHPWLEAAALVALVAGWATTEWFRRQSP